MRFAAALPVRPYCADDLSAGLRIRPRATASRAAYIQANPPPSVGYLVLDVDHADTAVRWHDVALPPPTWIALSESGRGHVGYELATPVCRTDAARPGPLRYLAAVEAAYQARLGADPGYVGLITKNPLHPRWRVYCPRGEPYSLAELADWVDLPARLPRRESAYDAGFGRNCTLFDALRRWAYRTVRDYWRFAGEGYETWAATVLAQAEALNVFSPPLPWPEVRHTARSVAKKVWRAHYGARVRFRDRQAARGRQGAAVTNAMKAARAAARADHARTLRAQGHGDAAIGKILGVHRSTVYRLLHCR